MTNKLMQPQKNKYETTQNWTRINLAIFLGFGAVISLGFSIGASFRNNATDHMLIRTELSLQSEQLEMLNQRLQAEIHRSLKTDNDVTEFMHEIKTELAIQTVTNEGLAITLDKIEKKMQ